MPRFTLYRSETAKISDATEQIRSVGARLIAARPGLALIETSDEIADQLQHSLNGWRISKEVTAKIAPPRPQIPPKNRM